jgi:hypothetical protein
MRQISDEEFDKLKAASESLRAHLMGKPGYHGIALGYDDLGVFFQTDSDSCILNMLLLA